MRSIAPTGRLDLRHVGCESVSSAILSEHRVVEPVSSEMVRSAALEAPLPGRRCWTPRSS
ncbi:hypothetical protein T03_17849 [Trichinella britovi]|uniref:Uncharacterized protein n=1 Tax=Trichinella britovi TaxID=45882 RepID=A0A0V1CPM5_TRIBR|nr:hypothetical protein T03_17849 [Trichinella britovi]